jgi:hypothetical protein
VGVGVDSKGAAEAHGLAQQVLGRVLAFGARIDLHRSAGASAGGEDGLGVEGGLGAAAPSDEPSRAVAQDVGVGTLDGGQHALRHGGRLHAQLGVHTGDDDVQLGQQVEVLVERAVLEDVHLNAGQDPEGRQILVQLRQDAKLVPQPLSVEPVRHGEAGAVVGQDQVLVAQRTRRLCHFADRAATVGPVRVGVAVTAE